MGHDWVMTVYNYKLLLAEIFDPQQDICREITSHEEQGWEFISGNGLVEIQEGYSTGTNFCALMRKPK